MMSYIKDSSNPVFLVELRDQYGSLVTGVTSPTVYLSKSQTADTTTVQWVETTDFTWHELTSTEIMKGVYKLRQIDSPNVDAVDTLGQCMVHVYKTDVDTAYGARVYSVGEKAGYSLAATGLDLITATVSGVASTWPEMMVALWRRFKKKHKMTSTELICYDDDGTTPTTTQSLSDTGAVQDVGAST